MKTITKTLYTFGELVEAQKQGKVTARAVERAREWMIEGFQSFDWWDSVYETWTSALEQIGFMKPDISFSGFWSQGDGASFTCSSVDLAKLKTFMSTDIEPSETIAGEPEDFRPWLVFKAKGKSPANRKYMHIPADYVSASVCRISNLYSHENTCRFDIEYSRAGARLEKVITAFEKDVEQLRRDLCRGLYRDLEEEWEYQTADQELIESSESNEYTFDAAGHREG